MNTKGWKKKTLYSAKRSITPETSSKRSTEDLLKPTLDWDKTLSSKELSTWKKRDKPSSRRKMISSSRQMTWTCHSLRPEKDSKIGSSKTMLKSNKWTRRWLKQRRWLILITKTLKIFLKIWLRTRLKETKSKSTRSSIKRRRKSTHSQSNSRKRRLHTKRRSWSCSTITLLCSSICKRTCRGKTNCQHPFK